MIVQLTDYGVSVLTETKKPLEIAKYILGSAVNYTPSQTETGIHGEQVYTNSPTNPVAMSANVVKYTCTLSYEVGTFSFGEVAFFDKDNNCLAVGVADVLIEKQKYKDSTFGNSIILDLYLSMVDGNYDMWIDDMRSDNEFNLPVCGSPDALPPVSQSSSNFYIITNAGRGQSSTLAYASMQGLWDFDCYQYKNSHEFEVVSCTAGSVTINIEKLTEEDRQLLMPDYAGQLILEFIDGPNQSICRTISSFTPMAGNVTGVFTLSTPMVTTAEAGDTFRVYSRQVFSISDVNLPIASESALGAIKVGDGLSIETDGTLNVDFPVTSVNGQVGDVELSINDINDASLVAITNDYNDLDNKPSEYLLPMASDDTLGGVKIASDSNIAIDYQGYIDLDFDPVKTINGMQPDPGTGNITIKFDESISGLIFPKRIYAQADLNEYSASGLYYVLAEDANTLTNAPANINFSSDLAIQVLPIGEGFENGPSVQAIFTEGYVFVRQNLGDSWTPWSQFMTAEGMRLATTTQTGVIQVGDGLSVTDQGILSANVQSVFGLTGNVQPNKNQWIEALAPVWNTFEGIAQLTNDESETGSAEDTIRYGRIDVRQLTWGALFYVGEYDAENNTIDGHEDWYIDNGGSITCKVDQGETSPVQTFVPRGWILKVSVESTTRQIDDINRFRRGDLIITLNGRWTKFYEARSYAPWAKTDGFLVQFERSTYGCSMTSSDNSITVPANFTVDASAGTIEGFDLRVNIVDGGTF